MHITCSKSGLQEFTLQGPVCPPEAIYLHVTLAARSLCLAAYFGTPLSSPSCFLLVGAADYRSLSQSRAVYLSIDQLVTRGLFCSVHVAKHVSTKGAHIIARR